MVARIPAAREDYLFAEQTYRLLAGESASRRRRRVGYEDPADVQRVRDKAEELLRRRRRLEQPRGWLGVSLRASDDAASESSLDQGLGGVVIDGILHDSPAARSGLKVGDLVVDYDGEPVTEVYQFVRRVGETRPGTTVPVNIIRNGSPQTLRLSIGETVAHNEASFPELGLSVRTLTPSDARRLGFAEKLRGVLVTGVEPGGRAAVAGLRVDDVVYRANVAVRANETAYVVQSGDVEDVDGVRRMVERGKQQIGIADDPKIPVSITVWLERHARTQHPPRPQAQGWQAVITKTPEGNWQTNVDIYLQP
jgi:S1-C subfamily serine protease